MATKQIDLKKLLAEKTAGLEPSGINVDAINASEKRFPRNLMFDAEAEVFKPETKPVSSMAVRSLTVEEAKDRDQQMSRFVAEVLVAGVDYGVVPRTSKPTLLKPGAEKILNFLGLVARTEVVNRIEDISIGFFCYEVKVFLVDRDGLVRAEGLGIANSLESRYAKNSGFAVQNTLIKMAKKRALVDSCLNAGSLSGMFTQDLEDGGIDPGPAPADPTAGRTDESFGDATVKDKAKKSKAASQKQIKLLESLMQKYGASASAVNKYVAEHYGVGDYHDLLGTQATELIDKFMSCYTNASTCVCDKQ